MFYFFIQEAKGIKYPPTRLAEVIEHRASNRKIAGSKPRPGQHSGSLNNLGESDAFLITSAYDKSI